MNYFIVNAFTESLEGGNPAAVCILEEVLNYNSMQNIASEFGLSETAFIESKDGLFGLRWFTPTVEVDLCGHATLAGAHILWEQGFVNKDSEIRFDTKSGILNIYEENGLYVMDFPREDANETGFPGELKDGLGFDPIFTGKNRFDFIAEAKTEEIVRSLAPDIKQLEKLDSRGVIVTAVAESNEYDFVSRFFAPNAGIPEDPVTGSAHCCLGPYWAKKLNKSKLTGYQASERGGFVYTELAGERVLLGGNAVTFSSGKLMD